MNAGLLASMMLPRREYGSDATDLVVAVVVLAVLVLAIAGLVAFVRLSQGPRHHHR